MPEASQGNRPYFVPAAPFKRIVREYIDRMGDENYVSLDPTDADDITPVSNTTAVGLLVWGPDNDMDEDKSWDSCRRFLQRGDSIEFDRADRIVTRLLGAMAWHTDPELREIWHNFDLTALDLLQPTCDSVVEEFARVYDELGARRAAALYGVSLSVAKAAYSKHRVAVAA